MLPLQDHPIRILMIDDHAVLRTGLRMIIESHIGMTVVGEAENRRESLAAIANQPPDIILLDLDLGDENGLDLLPDLLTSVPDARIILLTGLRDPEVQRRAILLGAMGLVSKQKAADTVIRAIEKVYAGEVWLDRAMIASILNDRVNTSVTADQNVEALRIAKLTEREREVIRLIGEGIKNRQIAERMYISEATVRHHLTSVFAKLGVADRFELVIYAFQHGLAKLPQ
jgi:two-component system, NarL family, nitrate/nitrite response regulator NarL